MNSVEEYYYNTIKDAGNLVDKLTEKENPSDSAILVAQLGFLHLLVNLLCRIGLELHELKENYRQYR